MEAKEKIEVNFSFNHLQYGIKRWPAFEVMNCLFKQEGQNLKVKISISLKWSPKKHRIFIPIKLYKPILEC